MRSALRRPSRHPSLRIAALAAAIVLAAPLAGFAADTAVAVPTPSSSASAFAEVARTSIHGQTSAGAWLQGAAVDPARDRLYVADTQKNGEAALSVLNLQDGAASTVPLAGEVYASDAAVSPVDGTVYVVHNTADSVVSVLDPQTNYTSAVRPPLVAVGKNAQLVEVGSDGRAYVVNFGDGTVSILGSAGSADRLNVIQTLSSVATSGATTAIDNDRNLLFIASEYTNTVTVVNTAATPAAVVGTFSVPGAPTAIGVDPRTGSAVVATADNNSISWFASVNGWASASTEHTEALGSVAADLLLPLSVDVRPDGTALVVTQVFPSETKSFVSVVPTDVTAASPVRTIGVGNLAFGGVLDPQQGGSLYVPNSGNGGVSVLADVTLTAAGSSTSFGQDALAQVGMVRADGYPVTASVAFTNSLDAALGTAALDATGTATVNLGAQPAGSTSFTATVTSPASITLSVAGASVTRKAATTTAVELATANPIEGDTASVQVTVTAAHGTAPTGTVTVQNDAQTVGSATLSGGKATVEIPSLAAGTTQLKASYAGDTAHEASASAGVELAVRERTAKSVLNASSGKVGGEMTINVTGFAPRETVGFTLYSKPVELGSISVDATGSGSFTFTVPQVKPGTHTIVALGAASGRSTSTEIVISQAGTEPPSPGEGETPEAETPAPGGAAPAENSGGLAVTGGAGPAVGLGAGLALLLGGSLLVMRSHRRRSLAS